MTDKDTGLDARFTMMMTTEEREKLDALAKADHRSAAGWVRVAIVDAFAARFPEAEPKKRKK